ncbi:DUF4136 domain-containing protein [Reichenbachiella sp. MSK19-1]|uniref:DUF4136 domain-containing protein n=1 Tax=Reichenbachiella sp. MSK19-1 TaxID=1897631 RepID=UPI000E6BE93F|nr:DUF4136 domain-containing protein [Reichenbachiella sp. MSK19-1]RJE75019.1 hypothetical protein BGP76_18065 [Reichenbachiella sp. MSK19-1]
MKNLILILIAISGLLYGCYYDDVTTADQLDVVATSYNLEAIESGNFITYSIPDSILHHDANNDSDHQFDQIILDEIKQNLDDYGYTEVNPSLTTPDLIVLPEVLTNEQYEWGGCWDCWYWWDPWYPGWGWGYYPPTPGYVYSYETGSIIITIIDQNAIQEQDENSKALWVSVINGVLRQNLTKARINELIDQAFVQSPYLDQN